jgi:hypothetical protein
MTEKEKIRIALCGDNLLLAKDTISNDYPQILAEVDSFVAQSQGNDTIESVFVSLYDVDPGNYERWDKVGQGVGNLKSLCAIGIFIVDGSGVLDWEILARILPHIQNKITLQIDGWHTLGETGDMFVRTIQGHPAITRFDTSRAIYSYETAAPLFSALTTLPNLESAVLGQTRPERGEETTFQSPESITEFLRTPSLRNVELRYLRFTSSLCQATAMALRKGSSITSLLLYQSYFPEGGSEQIASALKENTTLTTFEITSSPDSGIHEAFYDAMAASLLSNSTLQNLVIKYEEGPYPTSVCVSSLLLALGMNKTLRKLHVSGLSSVGGSVIPALCEGLGKNSTLEILELILGGTVDVAHVTSFCIAVVEAIQLNRTLKTLDLCTGDTPTLTDDEVKHLTSVVKKNYGLERLITLDLDDRMGDLRSILRLNGAGRGYLQDGNGSVVSKGVGVLSAVSDDLNCVFLHLLENPLLCSRSRSS